MAPTQTVTILFCDLVSSTERRARLGDDAFDVFTIEFIATLRATASDHGGRVVKQVGDGLMVVFAASAADAVECASAMHRSVARLALGDPPRLRIGVSAGEVAEDGDDFAGMPIVEAARLEAAAAPGTTLASGVVRSLVGTRRALRFRDVGSLTLKGLPAPLPTVEVIDDEMLEADAPSKPEAASQPPSARRPRALIAVTLVALVALVGGVMVATRDDGSARAGPTTTFDVPKGYTPRFEPSRCEPSVTTDVPDATCGELVVPQDRSHPKNGHEVRITVVRAPPRAGVSDAAPTIDLDTDLIATSPVRDQAELIEFGNRGFAGSTPTLTCPELSTVFRAGFAVANTDPTQLRDQSTAISACRARLVASGIDPANFNIDAAALDTIDLIRALELPQVDLLTGQQLSAVAFDMLRRAPGLIRTLTLQNPFPNGRTDFSNPTAALAGAFQRYTQQCTQDPVCHDGYPDLMHAYVEGHARLAADPPLVTTPDPTNDASSVPLLLDGDRAAEALTNGLTFSGSYPLIPAAIMQASLPPIASQAALYEIAEFDPAFPWGANLSFTCSYDFRTVDLQAAPLSATEAPAFDSGYLKFWARWCDAWKVPSVPDAVFVPAANSVPAFFYKGDLSPHSQPSWIELVARGFPNSTTLVFPTMGDDFAANGPPCLASLRRRFLADPQSALPTRACVASAPRIEFVAPTS